MRTLARTTPETSAPCCDNCTHLAWVTRSRYILEPGREPRLVKVIADLCSAGWIPVPGFVVICQDFHANEGAAP
jgi:hypothetical protein